MTLGKKKYKDEEEKQDREKYDPRFAALSREAREMAKMHKRPESSVESPIEIPPTAYERRRDRSIEEVRKEANRGTAQNIRDLDRRLDQGRKITGREIWKLSVDISKENRTQLDILVKKAKRLGLLKDGGPKWI